MSMIRFLIIVFGCALMFSSCKFQERAYNRFPDRTGWAYTFKKDNTFRYDFADCYGYTHGSGKYEIVGDTIRFLYDDGVEQPRGKIEISKTRDIQDSIIVNLTVLDSTDNESIAFYDAAIYQDGVLIKGYLGGLEGDIEFGLTPNEKNYSIEVSYMSFSKFNFIISKPGEYKMVVYLSQSWTSRKTNVVEEFRLIELNKEEFIYGGFELEGGTRLGRIKN